MEREIDVPGYSLTLFFIAHLSCSPITRFVWIIAALSHCYCRGENFLIVHCNCPSIFSTFAIVATLDALAQHITIEGSVCMLLIRNFNPLWEGLSERVSVEDVGFYFRGGVVYISDIRRASSDRDLRWIEGCILEDSFFNLKGRYSFFGSHCCLHLWHFAIVQYTGAKPHFCTFIVNFLEYCDHRVAWLERFLG